jgi:sugar phosphate isomerase/epimerase
MQKIVLAAQLYTLRDYMKTPEEIKTGLGKVHDIGYTSVQVSGIGAIEAKELKKICRGFGLTVCATHIPLEGILNDTENVAEYHKILECPVVGIGSGPGVFGKTDLKFYSELAVKLNEAGLKLKNHGLHFAYHNHNPEFRRLENGMTGFDYIIKETDPELVGFILDTYWVQAGGASSVEYIKRLKGRIDVIHYKDMTVDDQNRMQMAEIGGGNLNWHDIVAACEETGVKAAAIEQDICPRDPFDCLRSSYEYLNGTFGLK